MLGHGVLGEQTMTRTSMPAMLVGITTSGDDEHDGIE